MINERKESQSLLSNAYLKGDVTGPTTERVRPSKWAATALLARAYLYTGDYANAEIQASSIISNSPMFSLSALNDVFLQNSNETIWSLQPTFTGVNSNTGEGRQFVFQPSWPS